MHGYSQRKYKEENTIRRKIDIETYQFLFFLSDTSLCLFGDEFISPVLSDLTSKSHDMSI